MSRAWEAGARVRSGAAGATYGQTGTVTTGKYSWMRDGRVYVRWDGSVMSSGYRMDSEVAECLIAISEPA